MTNAILGKTFTDKITGFTGVCTGRVEYLTGCHQLLLSPKADGGKPPEACWFDEQRCEHVVGVPQIVIDNGANPGCDTPAPVR